MKRGYSIIEILVVIGVFAILAVLATQSINLSLSSSKKGDSIVMVKQELDNAANNIERLLQNTSDMDIGVDCDTPNATPSIGFRNLAGDRGDIACLDFVSGLYTVDSDKRIALSTGETINYANRLTTNKIDITTCTFSCYTISSQTYVEFLVKASTKGMSGAEGATFETSRKIFVRESIRK